MNLLAWAALSVIMSSALCYVTQKVLHSIERRRRERRDELNYLYGQVKGLRADHERLERTFRVWAGFETTAREPEPQDCDHEWLEFASMGRSQTWRTCSKCGHVEGEVQERRR